MPFASFPAWRFIHASAALIALAAAFNSTPTRADGDASPPSAVVPADSAPVVETRPAAAIDARSLVSGVTATVQSAADQVLQTAQNVTGYALELIGVRYKFGGETPDKGLDCSGLVKYVFEQVTGVALPRSAKEQAKVGEKVALDELQPGDLVFFNTRRFAFSHVGIYLGDNNFIHAPHRRGNVTITSIDGHYWKKHFNGARRLLRVMPGVVSMAAAKSLLLSLPVVAEPAADN